MITAGVFVAYTLVILLVAFFAYAKTHKKADFLIANRGLSAWSAALSAGASDMSGWLLLGLPGLAYVSQMEAGWLAIGLAIGTIANWRFITGPLQRRSAIGSAALTLPEYFANRYPECAMPLRICTAILVLVFYVFYISAGFVAAAKLFTAVFPLSYLTALLVGGSIVVIYTLVGGFRAVVNTDCIQAIMMIFALLVVFAILASQSVSQAAETAAEISATDSGLGFLAVLSALAWGLGYPGQPHILVRFMAIGHGNSAALGARITTTWTLICLLCAVGIGSFANGHAVLGVFAGDPEQIFISAVQLFFHPVIAGALSAAVLAAIMSTADSQLLIAATALFHDLGGQKVRTLQTTRWLIGIRVTISAIATAGFVLALNPQSSVLGLVSYAWAGFGATLGPAVILSLFADKMSGQAVFFGMLAGAITVVSWETQVLHIPGLYSLIPAFAANFLVAVLCSKWSSRRTAPKSPL